MARNLDGSGIPLLNPQLHPAVFQSNLPPQPELRSVDSVRFARAIPIDNSKQTDFQLYHQGSQQENYAHEMLRGRLQPTPVAIEFFSRRNLRRIQDNLRYLVKKRTGYSIDDQDENVIKVTQQTMFYQYGLHPRLPRDPRRAQKVIMDAVKRLNLYVLQDILPQTISGVEQYLGYLRDASQNPMPHERPKNMSIEGTRSLRAPSDIIFANPREDQAYLAEN